MRGTITIETENGETLSGTFELKKNKLANQHPPTIRTPPADSSRPEFAKEDIELFKNKFSAATKRSGKSFALVLIDFLATEKKIENVSIPEFERAYNLLLREKVEIPFIKNADQLLRDLKNKDKCLKQDPSGRYGLDILGYKELHRIFKKVGASK